MPEIRRLGYELLPAHRLQGICRAAPWRERAVQRSEGRMVADEMVGVDVHAEHAAALAELDDAIVVAGAAFAAALPAIHPFSAIGKLTGDEAASPRL